MATLKIPSERREAAQQNLLLHKTRKTEGREKTYWDVARSNGAVLPRTSEKPPEKLRTLGQSRAQKVRRQTSVQTVEDPETRVDIPKENIQDREERLCGNDWKYSLTTS